MKKDNCNEKKYHARKINGYVLEPIFAGYSKKWESHHVTNPCVVRFVEDSRVFLGYRAGGEDDYYRLGLHDIWASHLGISILDHSGEKLMCRLALPIMTRTPKNPLPKTLDEYDNYMKQDYKDDICVLHDFRFFNYKGFLHVIYHEGSISNCYDCIVRMPLATFLKKIDQSIVLMREPTENIIDRWSSIWWTDDVWQPCGVGSTNRIFASDVIKGDDVFFELGDGTLQLCHRPMADGMAVLNTGKDVFAKATPDGLTKYGVFETNTRPGFTDNSHVGNNGLPTRAKIGDVEVYIDVTHGCFDRMVSDVSVPDHKILYYPYFRIKDYQTGELLYYSENQILEFDDVWREYTMEGAWVSKLPHLDGVMFVGGQIPLDPNKVGIDDEFILYSGCGDTAIAAAKFTIRGLVPPQVLEDIKARKTHQKHADGTILRNSYTLPEKVNGWEWKIENDPSRRNLSVVRTLTKGEYVESDTRVINTAPGYFDADAMIFDGKAVQFVKDVGWAIVYTGIRWDEKNGKKTATAGYGLIVLDKDNPEKLLYRTTEPLKEIGKCDGWTLQIDSHEASAIAAKAGLLIPAKVMFEIKRIHELCPQGKLYIGQMVTWQRKKSGMLSKDHGLYFPGA
jgi:hypothetical protein